MNLKLVFAKVGGHLTTLGFSVQAELAHHRQGQPPNICLSSLIFMSPPSANL